MLDISAVRFGVELGLPRIREEHRLKVLEDKVMWRIFGSKREEMTGDWVEYNDEDLRDLYSSPKKY